MSKAVVKENKMATMPVNKLMMNMGVPMIISMMLRAVYNIVDSAFVANMEGTGEMAVNYLKICCGWSFGILYFSLYEKVLQATGKSVYSTIAQIAGAAYATIIGQIASALIGLVLHLKANKEIKNTFAYMKPSARTICEYFWTVGGNKTVVYDAMGMTRERILKVPLRI